MIWIMVVYDLQWRRLGVSAQMEGVKDPDFLPEKASPTRRFSKTIVMRLGLRMRVGKRGLEIVVKFRMCYESARNHGQDSADIWRLETRWSLGRADE